LDGCRQLRVGPGIRGAVRVVRRGPCPSRERESLPTVRALTRRHSVSRRRSTRSIPWSRRQSHRPARRVGSDRGPRASSRGG
jgi:hypothetical protein